jgi:SAM-dependent methyltransferase
MGVDINETFIEAAGAKDPRGQYVVGDMRELSLRRKFDVVLCLGTTLSYSLTNDEVLATLRGFHRHLRKGGIAVVDVLNAIAFTGPRPFQRRTQHTFTVRGDSLTATIERRLKLEEQRMTEQVTWRGRRHGRAWTAS